jgi:hypothetical protein
VIVPISIEYIVFGCKEISEEFNTLFFKSMQKLGQYCKMKPPEFGQPELSNNESEAIHNIIIRY